MGQPVADPNAGKASQGAPSKVLTGVAVVLVVAYLVALYFMLQTSDDKVVTENIWSRRLVLLTGFEAVVFTAVGWLFGREVNRKQAEQAETAAAEAKEKAAEAAAAKAKGVGLQGAVLTNPAIANTGDIGGAGAGGMAGALDALRAQAESIRF
jgi:cytochrome bd-type quinol oxidase subunit 2